MGMPIKYVIHVIPLLKKKKKKKTETLMQPQEVDIKRFSKGEQTSVFFLEIFPIHNDKT